MMLRNEWWIVDADRHRGIYGQMAYLDFADNPRSSQESRLRRGMTGPGESAGALVILGRLRRGMTGRFLARAQSAD